MLCSLYLLSMLCVHFIVAPHTISHICFYFLCRHSRRQCGFFLLIFCFKNYTANQLMVQWVEKLQLVYFLLLRECRVCIVYSCFDSFKTLICFYFYFYCNFSLNTGNIFVPGIFPLLNCWVRVFIPNEFICYCVFISLCALLFHLLNAKNLTRPTYPIGHECGTGGCW